mgnify:CR=1 FL=1
MKKLFLAIALVANASGLTLVADSLDDVRENPRITASNHYAYPDKDLPELSAAPAGYEPFYMAHYGRHGSRWLCDRGEYDLPVNAMEGIDRAGHLTPLGKETLADLKKVQAHAYKRWGELTDLGAVQHQGIGRRMGERFPEIFGRPDSRVKARSSVVNRCVLSMTNEMQELKARYPQLAIDTDASESFMWYIARGATHELRKHASESQKLNDRYRRELTKSDRFVSQLVSDPSYARDSVDGFALIRAFFHVAGIQQNHLDGGVDFYHLFTPEELHAIWQGENASHYMDYSHAPQSGALMPYGESHLLRHLVADVDEALASGVRGADMHFGHEIFFLPLTCLMELGWSADRIDDIRDISERWRSYELFPMACNIQMIFYHDSTDASRPVLVKTLLNEREVTLPVTASEGFYYRWDDLRNYYLAKIDTFEAVHPELMPAAR